MASATNVLRSLSPFGRSPGVVFVEPDMRVVAAILPTKGHACGDSSHTLSINPRSRAGGAFAARSFTFLGSVVSINEFDSEAGLKGLDGFGSLFRRETTPRNRAADNESDLALFESEGEPERPPVVAVAVPVAPPASARSIHVPKELIVVVALVLGAVIGMSYARVAQPFDSAVVPIVPAKHTPAIQSLPVPPDPPPAVATRTDAAESALLATRPTTGRESEVTVASPPRPSPNRDSNRTPSRVSDRAPNRAPTRAPTTAATPDRRVAPNAPSIEREHERIRGLVNAYKVAYEQLDAAAASTVWSGVDMRALARASGALGSHSVSFDRCDITVAGRRATASCGGPTVGAVKPGRASWTFALDRDSGDWRIAGVSAR
jgi:hypothetical protein